MAGQPPTDAELIGRCRAGDRGAFGELYVRHAKLARSRARRLTGSSTEAEDVAAEAFARILAAFRRGHGPLEEFGPYLVTTIRHVWLGRLRMILDVAFDPQLIQERADLAEQVDFTGSVEMGVVAKQAFLTLPRRSQTVLWRTTVEGCAARDAAVEMGTTPTCMAKLAHRARRAFLEAYLEDYLGSHHAPCCTEAIRHLAAYVGRTVSPTCRVRLEAHLAVCERCRSAHADLVAAERDLRY